MSDAPCASCAPLVAAAAARAETAERELARLRARPRGGRPPGQGSDPKSQLVTAVCKALRLNRGELAARLGGINPTLLSPSHPFPVRDAERLMAALRALLLVVPPAPEGSP